MGHSHSSSHKKRLKSISSSKNCPEFTEVVDFEFSDVATTEASTMDKNLPKDLLKIDEHLKEIEASIANMSPDEFFVYFPTFKDDLHNCWQKVYGFKEENFEIKSKKHEIIDQIRELLRKLNARLQRGT